MNSLVPRAAIAGFACAASVLAHYTWIAPAAPPLEIGKTATLNIGHGHKFPISEEAINARQLDMFVLSPSGAKVALQPVASSGVVTAPFAVKEAGTHRIVLVQDRGIASRTPSGVKPGGRDQNPNASQAYRTLRTSIAYAGTAKSAPDAGKPTGIELELVGGLSKGAWHLQLLKQGKPAPGITVEVFLAGAAKAVEVGKTDSDGRLSYSTPPEAQGPAVFSAMFKDKPPAGASYDVVNYETSLYVSW